MLSLTLRSLFVANLIASAPGVLSQDLSSLPPCALSCSETALNAINKACAQTDFACLCKNQEFVRASGACYKSTCPADQLPKAIDFGTKTCAQVGVTLPVEGAANAASNAASGASNAASHAANATANAANATGNAISNAASNAAGAVGHAANSTANSPAVNNNTSSNNPNSSASFAVACSPALSLLAVGTVVASMLVLA